MNPRSFRTQLITLVILVLVPAGALVLLANVDRMKLERDKVRDQAVSAAKLAAASQAYYVKETRQLLATMTQFKFLVLVKDSGLGRTGMANLKLLSPDFDDFGLVERDGTVFCHTLGARVTGEVIPASFTRRALVHPEFAMSEVHRDPVSHRLALQFAYPVYRTTNEFERLMYATIKLPLLSSALADIPLPPGGTVTVLDRAGNIVARRPEAPESVGTPLNTFPALQKALAGGNSVFESDGSEQTKQLYAVSTVSDGHKPLLYIEVAVPEKLLFAEANARFGASFFGLLLVTALLLSLAWWFSERSFLRPVAAMLGAAERLTQGDLAARTAISKRNTELHLLAGRFDVMAEALEQRQKQLEIANAEITRSNEQLELRVRERTSELQTLNSELEAFSYSVSHDLRAPLRHIDGFAQILANDPEMESNATAQRYLGLITKAAQRMGTLIDDLLSFSRMARQSLTAGTVHSAEIVSRIVSEIETAEPERNIAWEIQPLPSVTGDAAMLRQVWENLIGNAVKYTRGKDPARICISADSRNGETVFAVADNGTGFDMKYANKLFGVFQRLHRDEEFEGTGIGLANVRRVVRRHGGRAWAEAEPEKGAKFFFSIPNSSSRQTPG